MFFYLCSIIVDTFSEWNLYENVATIMGQSLYFFYLCPIIVDTFSEWNLYENVTTIMGQSLYVFLPLSHNRWYI